MNHHLQLGVGQSIMQHIMLSIHLRQVAEQTGDSLMDDNCR